MIYFSGRNPRLSLSACRFSSFSKNAFFSCSYSSAVQTSLHLGSNDFVTAKHSFMLSQGYTEHSEQFLIPLSSQHLTTRYLHQFSGRHPTQNISSFDTILSLYPILSHSSAVWRNSSSVFSYGGAIYLGQAAQSFPQAAKTFSIAVTPFNPYKPDTHEHGYRYCALRFLRVFPLQSIIVYAYQDCRDGKYHI